MATAGGAGIGGKRAKDKGGYVGNITISSGSKIVATSSDYGEAQDLVNHLAVLEDTGLFKDPVCQCAFSVVDVRYNAEIADPVHFVVHGSSDRPERFPSLFSVPFKSLPILA